ncbi:long-chain-fatty-acid--CoA ligase [Hoyosella altamirensis]|uniref:Acyl-CoA synthetase (AMP-forming)/AMP-acid ligase II n=1 Tax=Hoyosella altamirensis TaxID=616997 RepID=A0A839RL11_9ACTN|nr:long-chain-fatty-acid--CoA ligase [Hoyosella altamirensis]MBB3036989.1 acyl-CoA synthetase (AMP-forming)/AMP-acid ligase II [Hoyosella altamirensis]
MNTTATANLSDLASKWAAETPDAVAIRYGDSSWTWAQWDDRIGKLAGAMRAGGVTRGDRVGFLDKNHPACLETILAAARLGATAVVLNWRIAGDELDYAIRDSGITRIFCGAEFQPNVAASETRIGNLAHVIEIGGDNDTYEILLRDAQPVAAQPDVSPDDVCVIMYSSGTTGRPKGVMLSQRNLVTHTENVATLFHFDRDSDVNLVAMPLFHVGGTSYALLGIHAGVPSIITREPDAASLFGAIAAGATRAFLVPPVISAVLAAGPQAIAGFSKLRFIGYGAAPMPLPTVQRALAEWPDTKFVHVYGQTEFAGVITLLDPDAHRDEVHPERLRSTGKPVPGAEVRVVDPVTEQDVAPGAHGEFWFRTPQQMVGYLNRPEDTAATITADGWLRTGDIGRVDEDGYVYIEDRIKDMIITGGENVYSPEVERVLTGHPAVADVAVFGIPDEHWGESVMAVICVAEGQTLTAEQVQSFARESLAAYKTPRRVEFIDAIPRNPSGKILKRELREPYWRNHDRQV